MIGSTLCRQNICPGCLRVVEHKRYEIHHWLFRLVAGCIGLVHCHAAGHPGAQQREEIPVKDDAQYEEDEEPANTDMQPPDAAAAVPTVFNIIPATSR